MGPRSIRGPLPAQEPPAKAAGSRDSAETGDAGATEQIEQDRLDLVVAVMRGRQYLSLREQRGQCLVAHPARRPLQPFPPGGIHGDGFLPETHAELLA
jgi:hypothetical protein